jgi:hypothetical protein
MAAVPIYVWNGTAWQETGPTIPANPIKYQASAPTSPSTGDIWVDSDADVTSGSQQFQRFRFVASGGETTISGADANGAVLAYTAGAELVVLNGSTLVRGQDYTATNGTSITGLSPALVANDVLEVFSFIAFNVANTYTQSQVDGFITSLGGTSTGWTSYTPTLTQGATLTKTVNYARYKQIGKTVFVNIAMTITSGGTAGSRIRTSLPIPMISTDIVNLGSGYYFDAGTAHYSGVAIMYDASTVELYTHATANAFGASPAVTAANNDVIAYSLTYEVA